jgi:hypothetical protein
MAARPSSYRTIRPRATSFKAHLLFSWAGQLMASSSRRPGSRIRSEVNKTPELEMLTVLPSPFSSAERLLRTRKRASRSIGKRSEWRRSGWPFSSGLKFGYPFYSYWPPRVQRLRSKVSPEIYMRTIGELAHLIAVPRNFCRRDSGKSTSKRAAARVGGERAAVDPPGPSRAHGGLRPGDPNPKERNRLAFYLETVGHRKHSRD